MFDYSDDTPVNGPQCYIILQGFYNTAFIEALHAVGKRETFT
jgi:hypothetical protein